MKYYPLEIFDDLIERNGINKYHEKFLLDAQMLDAVFLNQEMTEFSFHEIDQFGERVTFTEHFEAYINKIFLQAYEHFCKEVSVQMSTMVSVQDQKDKMSFYITQLNRLTDLSASNHSLSNKATCKWINRIKNYLIEKYSGLMPPDFLQNFKSTEEALSYTGVDYFEHKIHDNNFTDLYVKLKNLRLFADEIIYRDFRNWITTSEPHIVPKIRFACLDQEAAYIIEKMKKYFFSMTDSKVEKFNLFISNKGRKVKSNNLQRNRSEFLSNPLNEERKNQIDNLFN